jgi:3-methyladenine DNA glycosylase AlkD
MKSLKEELNSLANPKQAKILQKFFKTGKGEYGEGDIFLGIKVPEQRKLVAKYYNSVSFNELQELLDSKIHECRLTALLILVKNYEKIPENRAEIFSLYLKNTKNINNWDLVDLSAPNIVGNFLKDKDKSILFKLAESNNLWERRIAILSTFYFIKNNRFDESFAIAQFLLNDKHDLIHKAVGWMLREIGKRDVNILKQFLAKHHKVMPRTMLRYAIEKLPEKERKAYLAGEVK